MESLFSIVLFSAVIVAFLALIVRFMQVQKRRRRELSGTPEPETRKKKALKSSRPTRSRPARRRMEKEKFEEDEEAPEDEEDEEPEASEEEPAAAVLVEHEPSPIPVPRPLISVDPEPKPAAKAEPKPAAKAEPKPAPVPEPAVVEVEKEKTLREGLEKTRGGFISRIGKLFSLKKEIDDDLLGELEEALFTADIGPLTANKLFEAVRVKLSRKQLGDPDVVWKALREMSLEILNVPSQKLDFSRARPFVILVAGVNGVGKTTTIGKLASQYRSQGKRVLLAAADTFRAAAIDQLAVWADRAGCEIVRGAEGADPSSVVFDAVKKAKEEDYDIVIADTAGRLHTQVGLMEELGKVRRTAAKAYEGAPHESFLVLDATTGQNALAQADMFMKTLDFTGIVITKLDGTAKGGIILGVCDRMQVPVRYIGIGEKINDLRQFSAEGFVDALFSSES